MTADAGRAQEIEQRLRELVGRKRKLLTEAVGFHIPTDEINAICQEISELELERYGLTGK